MSNFDTIWRQMKQNRSQKVESANEERISEEDIDDIGLRNAAKESFKVLLEKLEKIQDVLEKRIEGVEAILELIDEKSNADLRDDYANLEKDLNEKTGIDFSSLFNWNEEETK